MDLKKPYTVSEDWQAVWAALFIIAAGLLLYYFQQPDRLEERYKEINAIQKAEENKAPYRTMEWRLAKEEKNKLAGSSTWFGKNVLDIFSTAKPWSINPFKSFYLSEEEAEFSDRKNKIYKEILEYELNGAYNVALLADLEAEKYKFKNNRLNIIAEKQLVKWQEKKIEYERKLQNVETEPYNQIRWHILIFILFSIVLGAAIAFTGEAFGFFASGFALIFALAAGAFFLSSQTTLNEQGYLWPFWALTLGLIINASNGAHRQMAPAIKPEFYFKVALLIIASSFLLKDVRMHALYYGALGSLIFFISYFIILLIIRSRKSLVNEDYISAILAAGMPSLFIDRQAQRKHANISIAVSLLLAAALPLTFRIFEVERSFANLFTGIVVNELVPAFAGALLAAFLLLRIMSARLIQTAVLKAVAAKLLPKRTSAHEAPLFIVYKLNLLAFLGILLLMMFLRFLIGSEMSNSIIDNGFNDFALSVAKWLLAFSFVSYGLSVNLNDLFEDLNKKDLIEFSIYKLINIIVAAIILVIAFSVYPL